MQLLPVEIRSDIEFARHDGVRLAGDLYLPQGAGPHPVVVGVHGGAWKLGEAARLRCWGDWLAARGHAFFAVTYRLAAPGRKSFPECFHDVRAAVQFARGSARRWNIDPGRMALMGSSAGAHLAALVALAGDRPEFASACCGDPHADLSTGVNAVIAVCGIFDLHQQWQHDIVYRPGDPITERLLGVSPTDDGRAYADASPLSYVSEHADSTAFLLVWGTQDDVVDCRTQSEAFMLALKRAAHVVGSVVLEGAPHSSWLAEPVDTPGSWNGALAPSLLRFLGQQLA